MPSVLPEAIQLLRGHADAAPGTQLASDLQAVVRGLLVISDQYDDCAARGAAEIATLSGLLARGIDLAPGQFAWEKDLGTETVEDLRISALEENMEVLRGRLIELQAWLEEAPGEESAGLLKELFAFEYAAAKSRGQDFAHW